MFKVFLSEIKYIFQSKWRIASIILVLLLPFLFAFLQISASWNPISGTQNLKIAVLNLDDQNLISKQTTKGIIESGQEIKFNGTNQKYTLNMQQVYGYNQQQAEELAKSNKYDAVYVIPAGYGANQISGPSNQLNSFLENITKGLTSGHYLVDHPLEATILINGMTNFLNKMVNDPYLNAEVDFGQANDVQTFFFLFGVLIHNSLYSEQHSAEALSAFKQLGISRDQLLALDTAIRQMKFKCAGETVNIIRNDNKEIAIGELALDATTIYNQVLNDPDNFFVNFSWDKITNQLLDGIFTSVLQSGNIPLPNFIDSNHKVQLYIGNKNSQITSELLNILSNSAIFYKNIYDSKSIEFIAQSIIDKIRQNVRVLIQQILINSINNIEGSGSVKGIAKILYPGAFMDEMAYNMVCNILNPLKGVALPNLFKSVDNSLNQLIDNNIKYFVLPTGSFITSVVIGNPHYTFGQATAPNLITVGLWLGILSLVFLMKNKRREGEEKVKTIENFFGKAALWVLVGVVQGIIMISSLLILGVSPNHAWSLFIFTLLSAIVLGLIAHGICSISRGGEVGILLLVFLAITQLSISYGVFPPEVQNYLLNWISYLSPTRYIINGYQNIMDDRGWVDLSKTTLPILAFLLFVPTSYFVNYHFDKISFNKYGNYKDFVIELNEE